TESGNVWLDPRYTSPYKFYQFWLNVSDDDAKRYIKIFTLLDRQIIEQLIAEHDAAPHLRALQKRLAEELTCMIHSKEDWQRAVEASAILFGGATSEALRRLDEQTLLQVFEGVPQFRISADELGAFIDIAAERTSIFPSKGECRKMIQGGGVSLNKEKVTDPMQSVGREDLIAGKYLLVQRGKKNYYLVTVE
ncbi:MAG: tyrosine--tRNA ligase, partial [Alistipes sp.]|nr:tyrosine--tRNA ligase [Alistipes sp.]